MEKNIKAKLKILKKELKGQKEQLRLINEKINLSNNEGNIAILKEMSTKAKVEALITARQVILLSEILIDGGHDLE